MRKYSLGYNIGGIYCRVLFILFLLSELNERYKVSIYLRILGETVE